jgi:hypothetical protein
MNQYLRPEQKDGLRKILKKKNLSKIERYAIKARLQLEQMRCDLGTMRRFVTEEKFEIARERKRALDRTLTPEMRRIIARYLRPLGYGGRREYHVKGGKSEKRIATRQTWYAELRREKCELIEAELKVIAKETGQVFSLTAFRGLRFLVRLDDLAERLMFSRRELDRCLKYMREHW